MSAKERKSKNAKARAQTNERKRKSAKARAQKQERESKSSKARAQKEESKSKGAKERNRRFRVKIANNQVWELPGFGTEGQGWRELTSK